MIAYDPVRRDRQVIRTRLWVHSSDENDQFCITYLNNRGWRVVGDTFTVDFTATGAASREDAKFVCSMNRGKAEPCEYSLLTYAIDNMTMTTSIEYIPVSHLCIRVGSSPFVLRGLSPGEYHVRIRPANCGRNYHVWSKKFTIR